MNSDETTHHRAGATESGYGGADEEKSLTKKAKPVTGQPAQRTDRSGLSRPPYNPGLQQLVEAKQAWSEPLTDEAKAQGFLGWHQRGYLPHCDLPGVTQFVTLRLHDAMPATRRTEWEALLHLENERERRKRLEEYLDRGHGECWLRQAALAELTEKALWFFDGQRYKLEAWVVMPNHVHLLVQIWKTPLVTLSQSWKRYIARESNKMLRREGSFWEREYWDTLMKSEEQHQKALYYTENNPVKARLVQEPKAWPWSSARFRDEYGRLCLPIRSADL
jgi:putative transposase